MRLQLAPEHRDRLRREIEENSQPRLGYFALLALATVIACMGLLANSPAVVIGAMLVAPLMSTILGLALGTVTSQPTLSVRAAIGLGGGILLVVVTAVAAAGLTQVPAYGSEIASRTRPTLLDLLVAVAAGLAGAYSLVRADGSAVLPGVAIATALVPPLTVAGLELSVADWRAASGALLLFFSNFLAIYLAATLVFTLAGFAPDPRERRTTLYRQYALPVVAFGVIGVVLTSALQNTLSRERQQLLLRRLLKAQARMVRGAQFVEMTVQPGRPMFVQATIRTPVSFDPGRVARMERSLSEELGQPVRLVVRSMIAKDADASGYLTDPIELDLAASDRAHADERLIRSLTEVSLDLLGVIPLGLDLRRDGEGYHARSRYRAPAPLAAEAIQRVESMLAAEIGAPFRLELEYVAPTGAPPGGPAPSPSTRPTAAPASGTAEP